MWLLRLRAQWHCFAASSPPSICSHWLIPSPNEAIIPMVPVRRQEIEALRLLPGAMGGVSDSDPGPKSRAAAPSSFFTQSRSHQAQMLTRGALSTICYQGIYPHHRVLVSSSWEGLYLLGQRGFRGSAMFQPIQSLCSGSGPPSCTSCQAPR